VVDLADGIEGVVVGHGVKTPHFRWAFEEDRTFS
jgi:hypothetical protein